MTRVFLSYAAEDGAIADRLVRWLRDKGARVFWFQDEKQQGRRFIREIERGISEADLFVVLLSPHYLASEWCLREREIAIRRENDLGRQLIYVLKVAETPHPASGMLGSYARLDATEPLDDNKLDVIARSLALDERSDTAGQFPARPTPVFRNRVDELAALVNAFTRRGGYDLWVVVSPPEMGKSWLLKEVSRSLVEKDGRWSTHLIDLREHARELRTNTAQLLGIMLNVDVKHLPDAGPLHAADLERVAAAISKRRQPQLYILDSADLLDPDCAKSLRSALSTVYQMVKAGGMLDTRLGLVIGTRRHDEWRGLGSDPRHGLRFEPHPLTEFGVDVVHEAVADLNRDLGADGRWQWAKSLHRLGEGLPALLVRSLNWAEDVNFLRTSDCDSDAAFDSVARPYIRWDLLAPESLLPSGSQYERQAMDVLKRSLRILSAYRLFTLSHLRYHLEADSSYQAALAEARWSRTDLWDALGRTSLCDQPVAELWQVIEPSIRRLLYRYYNRADGDRAAAHVAARDFYLGWTAARTAGREQQVVLVECLWHEASRMVIEQPDDVARLLPQVAANLALEFANSPIFEPLELSSFVVGRLGNDEEFQMLLQSYDGVFDEIIKSVVRTIGGTP